MLPPSLCPQVLLLRHDRDLVKKKALLVLQRFLQLDPGVAPEVERHLIEKIGYKAGAGGSHEGLGAAGWLAGAGAAARGWGWLAVARREVAVRVLWACGMQCMRQSCRRVWGDGTPSGALPAMPTNCYVNCHVPC